MLALAALMLMPIPALAAYENLEFVDANGSTGYYADRKSAYFPTDDMVEAIIAVKKAGQNRMFTYRMQFNRLEHTYLILSSQIIKYDTQEVLETHNEAQMPQTYRLQSPMNEIVDYLFAVKR